MPAPRKVSAGKKKFAVGEQLSLDLGQAVYKKNIVIVAMEFMHGLTFESIIDTFDPKITLDLRHAVRFDMPGTNRNQVFSKFKSHNTFYTQANLPWHQLTPADFMLGESEISQRLAHEILERQEANIMLLVPNQQFATYLRTYLNRKLSELFSDNWRIEEAS